MNAKQKQDRNDRILANAANLEAVRDVARKVLGPVDADLCHLIYDNMKLNNEMDMGLLEDDLKNACGLAKQLYSAEEAARLETIVGVYERCTQKPIDDED